MFHKYSIKVSANSQTMIFFLTGEKTYIIVASRLSSIRFLDAIAIKELIHTLLLLWAPIPVIIDSSSSDFNTAEAFASVNVGIVSIEIHNKLIFKLYKF